MKRLMKSKFTWAALAVLIVATLAYAGTPALQKYGIRFQDEGTAHSTPPSGYGDLYVVSDVLYFKTDGGVATSLLSASAPAWDDIGDPDADATIALTGFKQTLSSTLNTAGANLTITNTTADLTANTSFLDLKYTDDGDANGFFIRGYDNAGGDLKFQFGPEGALTITGTAEGTDAITITGGDITLTDGDVVLSGGDLSVTGNFSLTGSFYQSAIAAAAAGNTNLTIDASGNGTITLGGTSTGLINLNRAVTMDEAVTLGDAAADNITVNGTIVSSMTLDDGTTDSPSLTFQDATNETAVLTKSDGSDFLLTTAANRGLQVVTGNLRVGNGVPGTAAMDGEDFYVNGDMEVDGTATFDGGVTVNNTLTFANGATIDNAADGVIELNEGGEELKLTLGANALDLSSTSGLTELQFFDNVADVKITHATDTGADDLYISLTGVTDSSLIINSTGTGADALQIATSAGGIDITVAGAADNEDLDLTSNSSINLTATQAAADQIKLSAAGTIAGNAVNITTTDGGIIIDANGAANGDITIDAASVISFVTGNTITFAGTGLAVEFEGTADDYETTIAFTDPTADRTITFPDYTGSVPLVVAQDYVQTSQAGVGTSDVTGSAISGVTSWFTEGKAVKYTVGGVVTGANDQISVHLYFHDGQVCSLTTANGAAGDYEAEFTIVAVDNTHQRIIGKMIAEAGAEVKVDYAADTTDVTASETPFKLQIESRNAGDTITAEYVRAEFWNKAN